jgi:hypothetical protein
MMAHQIEKAPSMRKACHWNFVMQRRRLFKFHKSARGTDSRIPVIRSTKFLKGWSSEKELFHLWTCIMPADAAEGLNE